jgi:hypothetical protein
VGWEIQKIEIMAFGGDKQMMKKGILFLVLLMAMAMVFQSCSSSKKGQKVRSSSKMY